MKIALDYDGTYTRDHKFWRAFATNAIAAGHDVRVVTQRYPEEEVPDVGVLVVYTHRVPKRIHLATAGWLPDIWIDDHPEWIDP
jgi:hypothetical protein